MNELDKEIRKELNEELALEFQKLVDQDIEDL